jgi:hypothetical protein
MTSSPTDEKKFTYKIVGPQHSAGGAPILSQELLGPGSPYIGSGRYSVTDLFTREVDFLREGRNNSEINKRVDELQSSLNALTKSLNKPDQQDALRQQILMMQEQLAQLQTASKDLTARVVLPPSEELEIRLLTTNSLDRLEEYRSNQNIWAGGIGLFGGAVMGIMVNFVTGAEVEKTAWVLVVAFVLVVVVFAYFFYIDGKRVERVKGKFFQRNTSVVPDSTPEPADESKKE